LTHLDFRFHFFPWNLKPSNTLSDEDAKVVPISARLQTYFRKVEAEMGVTLTPGQKAWYALKEERMGEEYMKQEHPSTPDEPFEVATEGTYFAKQMTLLRRRQQITRVPLVPGVAVNTFWDWGLNDTTFIWFHQRVNSVDRFVLDYENHSEAVAHYARFMRDTGFDLWGVHFMPHDMAHRRPGLTVIQTLEQMANEAGIKPTYIVPRIDDKRVSINVARQKLPNCMFDIEECARGIECLDKYSREWDERNGVWKDQPRHDPFSNGADAYQQFAVMADELQSHLRSYQVANPRALAQAKKRGGSRRVGWKGV